MLTEFKQRQQFLHGDRRVEDRVGRQSARKLVKLWAEKESSNLERMARAGVPCPEVVLQHKHVRGQVSNLLPCYFGPIIVCACVCVCVCSDDWVHSAWPQFCLMRHL